MARILELHLTAGARRAVVLAGDGEQTDEAGKAVGRTFCCFSVLGLRLAPSKAGEQWTSQRIGSLACNKQDMKTLDSSQ